MDTIIILIVVVVAILACLATGFISFRAGVEHRKKIRIQYASTDERETMSMENRKEKKNDK